LKNADSVKSLIHNTYEKEIMFSKSKLWIDSSNALPWICLILKDIFPNAKFIHLIRDGRKVVSSFYNKFPKIMYNSEHVQKLKMWLDYPDKNIKPPPLKKYWRPLPNYGECIVKTNAKNRFEFLCWYWAEINMQISMLKSVIDDDKFLFIKLEDLVSKQQTFNTFLKFLGIEENSISMNILKRPNNVVVPKDYLLTKEQRLSYNFICGEIANNFGYEGQIEYNVRY